MNSKRPSRPPVSYPKSTPAPSTKHEHVPPMPNHADQVRALISEPPPGLPVTPIKR